MPSSSLRALRDRLDRLYRTFDHVESATDPVHIVRRYRSPDDREIVGFCAAGLAFGRVASVLASIEALLAVMGPSPAAFVRRFDAATDGRRLRPVGHRWIRGRDLVALMLILRCMLQEAGSIEQFFIAGDDPASPDIGPALDAFSARALQTDLRPAYGSRGAGPFRLRQGFGGLAEARSAKAVGPAGTRPGVCYFFPRPSAGSACKRLNMYLRWMVRSDEVDLGLWREVPTSMLVIPLDFHVSRLARELGLTERKADDWRTAEEITDHLREFDPDDPAKYDFAIFGMGVSGEKPSEVVKKQSK